MSANQYPRQSYNNRATKAIPRWEVEHPKYPPATSRRTVQAGTSPQGSTASSSSSSPSSSPSFSQPSPLSSATSIKSLSSIENFSWTELERQKRLSDDLSSWDLTPGMIVYMPVYHFQRCPADFEGFRKEEFNHYVVVRRILEDGCVEVTTVSTRVPSNPTLYLNSHRVFFLRILCSDNDTLLQSSRNTDSTAQVTSLGNTSLKDKFPTKDGEEKRRAHIPLLHNSTQLGGRQASPHNPEGIEPLKWRYGRLPKASYIRLDVVRKIHQRYLQWCKTGTNEVEELALTTESIDRLLKMPIPTINWGIERGTGSPHQYRGQSNTGPTHSQARHQWTWGSTSTLRGEAPAFKACQQSRGIYHENWRA